MQLGVTWIGYQVLCQQHLFLVTSMANNATCIFAAESGQLPTGLQIQALDADTAFSQVWVLDA